MCSFRLSILPNKRGTPRGRAVGTFAVLEDLNVQINAVVCCLLREFWGNLLRISCARIVGVSISWIRYRAPLASSGCETKSPLEEYEVERELFSWILNVMPYVDEE